MFYFYEALNTFYLRFYGVGPMANDHSDREETRYGHLMDFSINCKGYFICNIPQA